MNAADIRNRIDPCIVGREIYVYEEVSSTNDVVMELAKSGAAEGLTIFAEMQTAGRGRLGRRWQSKPGLGLWFSILLRPKWSDYSRLSLAVAVAICRALTPFLTQPAGIKWPNDIWLDGHKAAGILCEASGGNVVVGIGLNVLHQQGDFPPELTSQATSLALQSSALPERVAVAAAILGSLDELYLRLPDAFPEVLAECRQRSVLQGRKVRVETGLENGEGIVTGIDESGGLRIQTTEGIGIITAGEVTVLKY